jgi:deferrochelatase/peroxidase EfeB
VALQEGIYFAPGQRPGRFFGLIFLRTAPDVDARETAEALTALWRMYRDLQAGRLRDLPGVELPFKEDKTTVLLGFGRNAFELDGISESRPDGLGDEFLFRSALPTGGGPLLIGSGLSYAPEVRANMATEEFCVQVIAETKLAVDRTVVETWKLLADSAEGSTGTAPLQVSTFYLGFQRNDHRSWIDFHDGLSNLRSDERESVITVDHPPDVPWAAGGTYLAFLRLAVDLPAWRELDRRSQELAVGRDKVTGCPITQVDEETLVTDPGCPVGGTQIWESPNDAKYAEPPDVADPLVRISHVQRANHHERPASSISSRRIFRQGYEFLEWAEGAPGFRAGLNFVSFQDTPERLLRMLVTGGWLGQTNFGGEDLPELANLLSVYAAAIYFVPPHDPDALFPGAAALTQATAPAGRPEAGTAPSPAG